MKPSGDVATVPLLDRLVDNDRWMPREAKPFRTQDFSTLKASVATEVLRIFSTRCTLTLTEAAKIDPADRSVIDFGVPDFSTINPFSMADSETLVKVLRNALLAFEPRLLSPDVRIMQVDEQRRDVIVEITGVLGTSTVQEPFSFPMALNQSGAELVGEANAA